MLFLGRGVHDNGTVIGWFQAVFVFCLCYSSCQCSLINRHVQKVCSSRVLQQNLLKGWRRSSESHIFVLLRVRFEIITSSATSKRCPRCLLMAPEVSLIFPDVLHLDRFRRECFELRLSIKKCSHIWISALLWYGGVLNKWSLPALQSVLLHGTIHVQQKKKKVYF